MAGEMSQSEVTRENYPLHFAIADAFHGTVHAFDQYQGPYIMIRAKALSAGVEPYAVPLPVHIIGGHRLWLSSEDGVRTYVYDEATEKKSAEFLAYLGHNADECEAAISAAAEVTGLSPMTINSEQRLFVIPSGGGHSCLGFDVVENRTKWYAEVLGKQLPELPDPGTFAAYDFYRELEAEYIKSEYCRTHTTFDPNTPVEVQRVLESARINKTRVRLFYGHPDGTDWHEENDVTGTIGRSMGPLKVPLLIANARSSGGPSILTACIVKIVETRTKRVLYQHPNYKAGTFEIRPADVEGYAEAVYVDGELHARFKKIGQAERWIKKMTAA